MYCIDPTADEPVMLINKHIGFDEKDGQGIDGSLFQNELLQLDRMGKKRIQVWINSPGGTVMDGYSIYNAILKSTTKVDTYCVGIAASIAAVIFQAGRKRIMADYGLLMYHNPYGGNGGDELEAMRNSLVTMICARTGKSPDEIQQVMEKTTWIEAGEAFSNGFCDTVEMSVDFNKKRLTGDAKAMFLQGDKVLNSILNEIKIPKHKKPNMKLVTNKLGLSPDASEDNILTAIQDIQNKAAQERSELYSALNKSKREKDELEDKLAKIEKEIKSKMDEYNKLKADSEAEDCKNMLAGFIAQGRINADTLDLWTKTAAIVGNAEVKAMIEALPLSKTATRLVSQVGGSSADNEKALTNVVGSAMVQARHRLDEKNKSR